MKNLSLIVILVFLMQSVQGQITDSLPSTTNEEMFDYLMTKNKKQKKAGLILLCSGVAATGIGIVAMHNASSWSDDDWTAGTLLVMGGLLTTTASIPVLIVAGSNKKKAQAYVQIGRHHMIDMNLPNAEVASVGVKFDF